MTSFSDLRRQTGLSITEVAESCGKSVRTIYRWENDEIPAPKLVIENLKKYAVGFGTQQRTDGHSFKFIDLFAGIGGMRKAFEAIEGRCVFTSEWNKYSQQTYAQNFLHKRPLHSGEGHFFAGDITQVPVEIIPKHDVLLAGFPCQPFSIAGVSKKNSLGKPHGFDCETQGTLFFNIEQILRHHRPAAFLLENVKNLRSHDKGNTFKVIRDTLADIGYHFDTRVIDAKGWVPQHRERIFIAGFRDDLGFSFEKFQERDSNNGPDLSFILHPQDGSEDPEYPYTMVDGTVNDKYTLTNKLWSYLQGYAEKHRAKGNGFGFGLVGPNDTSRTLSARYYKDGSEILVDQGPFKNPRRLTPRECCRLMGFDGPVEHCQSLQVEERFEIPVSDTQAYKQFGNAVVVDVARTVAEFIAPTLMSQLKSIRNQISLDFPAGDGSIVSAELVG